MGYRPDNRGLFQDGNDAVSKTNKTQTIYKKDLNGNIREYFLEYDHERWRSVSGIQGGRKVESGWIYPEATNVGRANERSAEEQVQFEVDSQLTQQLNQGKYHLTIESAMSGASFYEAMLATKYDPKKHTNFPYLASPKLDGCVSGDGYVETEFGQRTVEQVYHGKDELILSYNVYTEKMEFKEITGKWKNAENNKHSSTWLEIELENGVVLKVTDNHLVFLPNEGCWREAGSLKLDDVVISI